MKKVTYMSAPSAFFLPFHHLLNNLYPLRVVEVYKELREILVESTWLKIKQNKTGLI